jgi:hypothetical protein
MSDDNFSIKQMVMELRADMRDHGDRQIRMEGMLTKTYEQALKTNGRVNVIEDRAKVIEQKQSRLETVFATVVSIIGIVWTGVTFIFK